ncbi:hypothetical protein [Flavobacterium ginsenosidimutans]|uniref:hypothetical protein n=1 Tax=Flavobacterium ginsenosidimutans TaxID=687844 RepID=UPI003D99A131
MKFLKSKSFFILMIISSFSLNAQEIRGFGSLMGYHAGEKINKKTVLNFGGGVEFRIHPLIRQEVALSYYMMRIKDDLSYYYENDVQNSEIIKASASALNISFGTKINGNGDWSCFYITPKLNMSKVFGSGEYRFIDTSNSSNNIYDKGKAARWQHSFGIGAGIEIPVSEFDSIALHFDFCNIQLNKSLNKLPTNQIDYGRIGFGGGIVYYFAFKKKQSQNE